ncbi:conserved Plasmodium protein, unknown function [Plasmodium vivax]|nr:unnamed protein product [Plasmodium vivax]CAI7720048.1 EF hand domain-containing protein, putative [Plasmodium vivax]SCO72293.1 conserved Plasmodium protein, unknown function [Plasmodium vivax]VUZ95281.1 conserved Plasmodium protein, unknown function [Plasmodium vivax]
MDERIELLVGIIKQWTRKYAYRILVKGKDEEKGEHYYKVTFYHQNENESIAKCTVNAAFTITEVGPIDVNTFGGEPPNGDKYFVTFKFENENLVRTVDMGLNCEAWIDKLIKDKEKLRNNLDLSSEFMRTRFIKPADEGSIEAILQKIKDEREAARRKKEEEKELREKKKTFVKADKLFHKKTFFDETLELDKVNSKADMSMDHGSSELAKGSTKNVDNEKLNEALSFLKLNLAFYFADVDIKKKGKLKQEHYVEILKMVNHKMCVSHRRLKSHAGGEDKPEPNEFPPESYPFYESNEEGSTSTDDSSKGEFSDTPNIPKGSKKGTAKKATNRDDKKKLLNLFNVNNKEVDLIKDISIYKNNMFNGSNIFYESKSVPRNCEFFLFDQDNEFYPYIFTDNYYDFLLYISFADEEDNGCVCYNNYLHVIPTYLYELKRNREHFEAIPLDSLLLYKQLIFACYENELNFMYETFLQEFRKYDPSDSGFIHRSQMKRVLLQNEHIMSRQEYKLLLRVFSYNDDNYVYYRDVREVVLRLRFEGIRNSIFERNAKMLQKYLCQELVKHNLKGKKKIHIFDCKNVLDSCSRIYLNKNIIHIILSSLNFDRNLELDVAAFLRVSITIIINSIKLDTVQKIYNSINDEKQKKEDFKEDSAGGYKGKGPSKKSEKTNIPALELVERTLTKLFKVLDEKNEDHLKIIDFIETLLESNQKKKIIDIKEICKLSKNELQGFVAEIDTDTKGGSYPKDQMKDNRNFDFYKNKKIHYSSHIHKWCSKTYQIRSCKYYSYFFNYPDDLIEIDDELNKELLFCEEEKE